MMLQDLPPAALGVIGLLVITLLADEDTLVPSRHIASILLVFELFFDVEMDSRGELVALCSGFTLRREHPLG